MVEVFKTNVAEAEVACRLIALLQQHWPTAFITFDLEDCDKVLRFENLNIDAAKICELLIFKGFMCEIMG